MKNVINHSGIKYGTLMVLYQWVGDNYRLFGFCRCDCGTEKQIRISHLVSGKIISCGCIQKERIKYQNLSHGQTGTLQHRSWKGMKSRCYNKRNISYSNYGGRGITVCDRWLNSYDDFIKDVGLPPSPDHSLDRINNNGNYEHGNVKWSMAKEQAGNRRKRGPFKHKKNRISA